MKSVPVGQPGGLRVCNSDFPLSYSTCIKIE